jgi:gamma-glutamyltranspeptidase
LTWKELVDPTVELCDEGFEMSKHMEDSITINPIIVHDEYLKYVGRDPMRKFNYY